MDPKSGKPLRLFNPLAIWADIALKSGGAMLDAAQAAIARPRPKVVVISTDEAPGTKTSKAKGRKARKSASSPGKRRGR